MKVDGKIILLLFILLVIMIGISTVQASNSTVNINNSVNNGISINILTDDNDNIKNSYLVKDDDVNSNLQEVNTDTYSKNNYIKDNKTIAKSKNYKTTNINETSVDKTVISNTTYSTNNSDKYDTDNDNNGLLNHSFITNNTKTYKSSSYLVSNWAAFQSVYSLASNGDTIYLNNGVYIVSDTLTLEKDINIEGYSYDGVILNGGFSTSIFKIKQGHTITIKNITFINAYSTNNGCVINNEGNLTLLNTAYINNTVNTSNNINCGAIFNIGNLNIYNSYFNNNKAKTSSSTIPSIGGAICNKGILTVYNSNFINNTALFGGAIYNSNNSIILRSKFINNSAYRGGAIYNEKVMILLFNTLNYNNATTGGAIINTNYADITLKNNTISNNNVTSFGGAIINYDHSTMVLTNNTITNNVAESYGGAIININYGNVTLNTNKITNNVAMINGGALSNLDYSNITVINNIISNNTAYYYGGAIDNEGNSYIISIYNSINNNIAQYGGAIYNSINSDILVSTNIIISNAAVEKGGIIYNIGNLTVKYNIFSNNTDPNNILVYNEGDNIKSLNYNWWGQNTTNYATYPGSTGLNLTNYNGIHLTTWLYLNLTFNSVWEINTPLNITADLTRYSTGTSTGAIDGTLLALDIPVTFISTFNSIYYTFTTLNNGMKTITLTPDVLGVNNITAYIYTNSASVTQTVNKIITITTVNPINGTVQNTAKLQANITDTHGNNVTGGKVVFKINGTTIKDTNDNTIYVNVTNGLATLNYTIPNSWAKNNLNIEAIYSGTTSKYTSSKNTNKINVTKRTAIINLFLSKNPVKSQDTVIFKAIISDNNGTILNNGQVVFKFQGKTIKDNNGNTIIANVTNSVAKLNYIVPNGISAKIYNITAVYSHNDYNRAESTTPLTTEKISTVITLNSTNTTRGSNSTQLTGIIKDTNGNFIVGTYDIAVKLNGKDLGTYQVIKGIINTNITIPNTLKNTKYNITVKMGDTNGYYGTNATTVLTINSIKTTTKTTASSTMWYVNTTGGGNGKSYDTPTTLSYVLNNLQSGDSIFLKDGIYIYGTTILFESSININIIGESRTRTILSGDNKYTIMGIEHGNTINITNITFINGNATFSSGAIFNTGNLTVNGSIFINNKGLNFESGAISNVQSNLVVVDSIFVNNTAEYGGAIYNNPGNLTVNSSVFINNTSSYGGAISNAGNLIANYNIFINNRNFEVYNYYDFNPSYSGVIKSLDYNWWGHNITNYQSSPDNSTLKLTNYEGMNLTKWLYFNMSSLNDFIYNTPVVVTANLTGYYDNSTSDISTIAGDETSNLPQNVTITFTSNTGTIIDNTTVNNGIATAKFTPTIRGLVSVTSTIYTNSTTLTQVSKNDVIYVNTTVHGSGTGVDWNNAVGTIRNGLDLVTDNGKLILAEGNYNVVGDHSLIINQNVSIIGQTQNKVIIDGLYNYRLMEILKDVNLNITNITFANGKMEYGAAIYNRGNLTVTYSKFINNSAIYAGAIENENSNLTVISSTFINNTARYGGTIINYDGNFTIFNSTFINNTASAIGGTIYNEGGNLTLNRSILINNTASYDGGAIYNNGNLTANYNILLNNYDQNNLEIYNYYTTQDSGGGIICSLDYNWWGHNDSNYQSSPDNSTLKLTNYEGMNLTKWLYLNMTSSTDNWVYNTPITIISDLTKYYTSSGSAGTIQGSLLPQEIPIKLTSSTGEVVPIDAVLSNGIKTVTYTSNSYGINVVTATVYNNSTSITNNIKTLYPTIISMGNVNGTTNQNITVNATVTSNGNLVNTGTVTFIDTNGLLKTVNVNNGIANIIVSYPNKGNYTITATYNVNDIYTSSQTTALINIRVTDVTMNMTVIPSTTTSNTTFNIIIKYLDGNNVTSGTINFYDNGTYIGNTSINNGKAVFKKIFNIAGHYNITAVYNNANTTVNFTIEKSNTTLVVNPINGMVQNTITLQANITDQYGNNVTGGKVVFKINGVTLKDSNGTVIYINVTNGIAQLRYVIPSSLAKNNLTIQAIYSGTTNTYNSSRNSNIINVTKRTANITLVITKNPVKAGDLVTFQSIIVDSNGTLLSNGQVIFKFQGHTIKDNEGNTIIVNVTHGIASLNYAIPNGISAKTYNITGVYSNKDYNRAESIAPITTEKIATIIILNPTNTPRYSNTTLLTGTIKDINGNLITGTHKIDVKLNDKTLGTYTVTNGIINTNITIPNTLKNTKYNITVKIGDTNGYYGTNATTTLTINNLKTLKLGVLI